MGFPEMKGNSSQPFNHPGQLLCQLAPSGLESNRRFNKRRGSCHPLPRKNKPYLARRMQLNRVRLSPVANPASQHRESIKLSRIMAGSQLMSRMNGRRKYLFGPEDTGGLSAHAPSAGTGCAERRKTLSRGEFVRRDSMGPCREPGGSAWSAGNNACPFQTNPGHTALPAKGRSGFRQGPVWTSAARTGLRALVRSCAGRYRP